MSRKHERQQSKSAKRRQPPKKSQASNNSQINAAQQESGDKHDERMADSEQANQAVPKQPNPLEDRHPGLLGHYHDLSYIGSGSQAKMLKALNSEGKPVAVKVFDLKKADNWKKIELFEREIDIIKKLHIQGIPSYIETIRTNDYIYLVEEYIDALSLEKQLDRGRIFNVDECIKIFERIAEILQDLGASKPPVVHRDIKPANILVDKHYNVYLVDFGVVNNNNAATFSMTFAGTAGYVAPEQLYGKATVTSDIFSLGATMLHLLTGVSPCDMKLKGISPDVDRYMPASVPSWMPQLIKRMMAVKPSQRPQSGGELIDLIKKARKGKLPVLASESDLPAEARKKQNLRQFARYFGASVIILLALLFLVPHLLSSYYILTNSYYVSVLLFFVISTLIIKYRTNPRPDPKFITDDSALSIELNHADNSEETPAIPSLNQMPAIVSLSKLEAIVPSQPSLPKIETADHAQPMHSGIGLSVEIADLLDKAKNGDSSAMVSLGYRYEHGYGVQQNMRQAFEWYIKAAEAGDEVGMYDLGCCYKTGTGVPINMRQAFFWYQKAAELGYVSAQREMGYFYRNGIVVDKDIQTAMDWYSKAAANGDTSAMFSLGYILDTGDTPNGKQDYVNAVKWYKQSADSGNVDAMYNLGIIYNTGGHGIQQNSAEALRWYKMAMAHGSTDAMFEVANSYFFSGINGKYDHSKAIKLWKKAALRGDVNSQVNLGIRYYLGDANCLAKNYTLAMNCFKMAAEKDHRIGMYYLGNMYYHGLGVNKDYKTAYYWLNKAAILGVPEAQNFIGVLYVEGKGVKSDMEKAAHWYLKAAENGCSAAQYNIGHCYFYGQGVETDFQKARTWLQLAADNGESDAVDLLKLI